MAEHIYKVDLVLPLLVRAASAEAARQMIEGRTISDLEYEISEGSEMIGGTRRLASVEHVPESEVEAELLAVGNDGTFFEDMD